MIRIKSGFVFVLVALSMLAFLPLAEAQVVTEYDQFLSYYEGITTSFPRGTPSLGATDHNLSFDMETLSGGLMDDFSTDENDATITGTTDVAGVFGRARNFDGTSDIMIIPETPSLALLPAVSVFLHVNPDLTGDVTQEIFTTWDIGRGYMMRVETDSDLTVWVGDTSTHNSGLCTTASPPVVANVWQWIGFTFDGTTCTIYHNFTIVETDTAFSGFVDGRGTDFDIGGRSGLDCCDYEGDIDELLIWGRALTDREISLFLEGYDYTYRFDSESIVPGDIINGTTWISGLNMTFGITTEDTSNVDLSFTANTSVWYESGLGGSERAISWDSFVNDTDIQIDFNFTMPSAGEFPYWVNNTHQDNLTVAAGAISFNWTDWLDGEHLFELGIEFTSTPILTGTIDILYSYQAAVTKTSITGWNLTTGPTWASISSGGLITGIPDTPGSHLFVVQSNATGGVTVSQTFTVIVPAIPIPPSLTNTGILFMIGFIPFLLMVGIGFWKEQGAMIIVGGIAGVLLGLWVIFALQDFGNTQFFGVIFVGIGILFSYIGWVNIDRSGGV